MNVTPIDSRTLPVKLRAQMAAVPGEIRGHTEPKVLSSALLCKLQAMNSVTRWLRQNGFTPIEADMAGERPCLLVSREAASFLCSACRGFNFKTENEGKSRIGYVLRDGCEIRWNERTK